LRKSPATEFQKILKIGIKSDNLQKDQIVDNLRKNADDEKIIEIIKMLETFDFYKFTSVNLDKDYISALLNGVETLIPVFKNYKSGDICKRSYKNG
jgi:hypothetical protein